jgi:MFS family permease
MRLSPLDAVGIWSAAAAVARGVAPAIVGAILDHGSWQTTFLMLLPAVAGALAADSVDTQALPDWPRSS